MSARLDFGELTVGMVSEVQDGRGLLWGVRRWATVGPSAPPRVPAWLFRTRMSAYVLLLSGCDLRPGQRPV